MKHNFFALPTKDCLRTFTAVILLLFFYLGYCIYSGLQKTASPSQMFMEDTVHESLACIFPHVEPHDPSILNLLHKSPRNIECDTSMEEITYINDGSIIINESKTKTLFPDSSVHCRYQLLSMNPRVDRLAYGSWSNNFTNDAVLPKEAEFLLVVCYCKEKVKAVSKAYYALVPDLEEANVMKSTLLRKRQAERSPKETLSVIMVGLDGVSRNQFIRSMNKTYPLLMNNFSTFDMTMYTQTGKNTFPNYLSLFGGMTEESLQNWWNYSSHSDTLDLVWDEFNKAGYRTLYAEDWPDVGGFHYLKKGFLVKPTNFFSRPISLALDKDPDRIKSGHNCVGGKPEISFHLDYVSRFLDTFPYKPIYATVFFTRLTHADMANVAIFDDYLHEVYNAWLSKGHLDRTLLITFSDHGPRYGAIRETFNGMVESRTPLALFTFPRWFLEKYPEVARNLRTNTARLTSHADTYATLLDLLYFRSSLPLQKSPFKRGLSLLNEIPADRTCMDVPIPLEFCLCGQKSLSSMNTKSSLSRLLVKNVLNMINLKTDRNLCEELALDSILFVVQVDLQGSAQQETREKNIYKVRLRTSPGLAVFEATVFTNGGPPAILPDDWSVEVAKNIDRLNLYNEQAYCSRDPKQRPYCYCKSLKTNYVNSTQQPTLSP
ncbi:hypothetical protein BgiBS90_010637 [Biomphalaria glabrata]|nr:hypothetical protein BgiBS90_010637 [Biomphalaria glabrata]